MERDAASNERQDHTIAGRHCGGHAVRLRYDGAIVDTRLRWRLDARVTAVDHSRRLDMHIALIAMSGVRASNEEGRPSSAAHGRPQEHQEAVRVRRLAAISIVALSLVWGLASATLEAPWVIGVILALGWLLMPAVLLWSLVAPGARYLLMAPASLVLVGLLAIWFRIAPVPTALNEPDAHGRWTLIGVHVALITVGWALAAIALLPA